MSSTITLTQVKYPGSGQATLLNTNTQAIVWNNVATGPGNPLNTGNASAALQLERQKSAFYPNGVSYEISFSGAPGAFEIDVQHSDTDADASYVTVNQITAVNSNNAARVELPISWTRFCRLSIVTLTNNVNITARVTR